MTTPDELRELIDRFKQRCWEYNRAQDLAYAVTKFDIIKLIQERESAMHALSMLAMHVSAGMGDETTTPEQYQERIIDGISMLVRHTVEYAENASRTLEKERMAWDATRVAMGNINERLKEEREQAYKVAAEAQGIAASAVVAQRKAEDELAQLSKRFAALEREADRLRHGAPIEGDFVCPDSLRADELERERDNARDVLRHIHEMGGPCPICKSLGDCTPDCALLAALGGEK